MTSSLIIIATIMGVQSQSALLFMSNEIKFNDIVYLIEQHHDERADSGSDGCSLGGSKGKCKDASDSNSCGDGCGNGCSKA